LGILFERSLTSRPGIPDDRPSLQIPFRLLQICEPWFALILSFGCTDVSLRKLFPLNLKAKFAFLFCICRADADLVPDKGWISWAMLDQFLLNDTATFKSQTYLSLEV
jgi:hypothetical protein